jgi:alpha-amylase
MAILDSKNLFLFFVFFVFIIFSFCSNYGIYLENALYSAGWSAADVQKVKIWNSGYPKEPEKGYCTISPVRNAIQNDDHDQQTSGSSSRDMGSEGCVLVKGCAVNDHRNFETKLFSSPNGNQGDNDNNYPIRLVLSSYYWQNGSYGVPDSLSECSKCVSQCSSCHSTSPWSAYDGKSCGYDETYTRPHRDLSVVNAMRSWMKLPSVSSGDLGLNC